MRALAAVVGVALLLGCAAPTRKPTPVTPVATGGWSHLTQRLVADGVPPERVAAVFSDPRMPAFDGLEFSPSPRESHARYQHFLAGDSVAAARRCRDENAPALAAAERERGVPASVVAAILHVETGCGRNTGRSVVLHRLARLAMANEPANVERNIARVAREKGGMDEELAGRIRMRARYLEDTFYPEVRATFDLAGRLGVDPLALRGSVAGAMGTPQFLPTRVLWYGADGNGDGRVDLHDPADAAASCATYLAAEGWKPGLSTAERRAVIWQYNRSDAYIDTVLALAAALDAPERVVAPPPAAKPVRAARPAGRRVTALRKP